MAAITSTSTINAQPRALSRQRERHAQIINFVHGLETSFIGDIYAAIVQQAKNMVSNGLFTHTYDAENTIVNEHVRAIQRMSEADFTKRIKALNDPKNHELLVEEFFGRRIEQYESLLNEQTQLVDALQSQGIDFLAKKREAELLKQRNILDAAEPLGFTVTFICQDSDLKILNFEAMRRQAFVEPEGEVACLLTDWETTLSTIRSIDTALAARNEKAKQYYDRLGTVEKEKKRLFLPFHIILPFSWSPLKQIRFQIEKMNHSNKIYLIQAREHLFDTLDSEGKSKLNKLNELKQLVTYRKYPSRAQLAPLKESSELRPLLEKHGYTLESFDAFLDVRRGASPLDDPNWLRLVEQLRPLVHNHTKRFIPVQRRFAFYDLYSLTLQLKKEWKLHTSSRQPTAPSTSPALETLNHLVKNRMDLMSINSGPEQTLNHAIKALNERYDNDGDTPALML